MNPKHPVKTFLDLSQNEKYPHIIDVSMLLDKDVRNFEHLHCHLVVYPFGRKINSDHIAMHPFSEYSEDIANQRSSVYSEIHNSAPQFFGLFLVFIAAIAVGIFMYYYGGDSLKLEALIALFGVYMIGKDFWGDIESSLQHLTKNWSLKYQDPYYAYELEKNTTLMRYSNLAKKERYGYSTVLPERMDYLIASNSSTVRLLFDVEDLIAENLEKAHLLSIRIMPEMLEDFSKYSYMIGIKLALSKTCLGIEHGYEMFQSVKYREAGSLDDNNQWIPNTVVARKFWRIGKLIHRSKAMIITDRKMIEFNLP